MKNPGGEVPDHHQLISSKRKEMVMEEKWGKDIVHERKKNEVRFSCYKELYRCGI